ncbi:SPOSA6832_00146, partial [Sporobolomyces salmonicolor]
MDDVEDDSHLRRGMPGELSSDPSPPPFLVRADPALESPSVAHKIYGIPQTINSANYVYFLAFQELQRIHPRPGVKVEEMVTDELLNLHRGQGMDLFWRENLICPTEAEYIDMVNNNRERTETGGLFRIAIKLMMAASPESPPRDYVPLANLIGIIFQIRDDYVNLQSVEVPPSPCPLFLLLLTQDRPEQYANNKGFCEDFSEGKFSFPIVHAIRADQSNRQILSTSCPLAHLSSLPALTFSPWADILRERPSSPSPKTYAVSYMTTKTRSFAYTRDVLRSLTRQAFDEVERLGGNRGVEEILKRLELEDPVGEREGQEGAKQ